MGIIKDTKPSDDINFDQNIAMFNLMWYAAIIRHYSANENL